MKIKKFHAYARVVIYILTTLVLCNCASKDSHPDTFIGINTNNTELDYTTVNKSNRNILPLYDIFHEDRIDYISLQPNNIGKGLIVLPRSVTHLDNNTWLINDPRNDISNALLFDKDGRFIKYIGSKGNGPGEYVIAGHCKVNRIKKRIEILDGARSIMLYFDYNGNFIKSIPLPILFTDIIQDPNSEGFFAYTLNNYNSYYMKDYGLKQDYVITKTNNLYHPLYGIEEVTLTPDVSPFKTNGNNMFYHKSKVGFINNFSNDLYLIDKNRIESLISFRINNIPFQNPEYIKVGKGVPFKETMEEGFGFVINLSLSDSRLQEEIMVTSEAPNRKYDNIYLNYSFDTKDYTFYSALEDSSGTFTIGRYYLDPDSPEYDAYAVIQPKDIEDMDEINHPVRNKVLTMLKENNNNPIIALLKFK